MLAGMADKDSILPIMHPSSGASLPSQITRLGTWPGWSESPAKVRAPNSPRLSSRQARAAPEGRRRTLHVESIQRPALRLAKPNGEAHPH
jgi:hypothetical protein